MFWLLTVSSTFSSSQCRPGRFGSQSSGAESSCYYPLTAFDSPTRGTLSDHCWYLQALRPVERETSLIVVCETLTHNFLVKAESNCLFYFLSLLKRHRCNYAANCIRLTFYMSSCVFIKKAWDLNEPTLCWMWAFQMTVNKDLLKNLSKKTAKLRLFGLLLLVCVTQRLFLHQWSYQKSTSNWIN